jgi:hypothetical protein
LPYGRAAKGIGGRVPKKCGAFFLAKQPAAGLAEIVFTEKQSANRNDDFCPQMNLRAREI